MTGERAVLPMPGPAVQPMPPSPQAEAFYIDALRELSRTGLPFLIAGSYAVSAYTGISRPTKDLDIFTTAGDFARILAHFKERGYAIGVEDERWLGKVFKGDDFFDVIFASANGTMPVTEDWFTHARQVESLGMTVPMVGPTELVWSKVFIQTRHRYDGADVVHVILKQHDQIDWRRLLSHMEPYWEVLLVHILNFRWAFPSERDHVPRWLVDELLDRLSSQLELPPSLRRVCRGRLFSRGDYEQAVSNWGFADIGGDGALRDE